MTSDDSLQRHRQLLAAHCLDAAIEMSVEADDDPPTMREIAEYALALADAIITASQEPPT